MDCQIRQLENEIANSNPQGENRADGNEEAASALQALQEKYDQLLAKTEEREMAEDAVSYGFASLLRRALRSRLSA